MSVPEGMEGLRDALCDVVRSKHYDREIADALLAPDGRLWPALRALGRLARSEAESYGDGTERADLLSALHGFGITGPLADACIAAAEAQP